MAADRVAELMALADEYARGHGVVSDENNYSNRAALERALRGALEPKCLELEDGTPAGNRRDA